MWLPVLDRLICNRLQCLSSRLVPPTTRACFFHHPKSYASPEDMYWNKSISFGMLLGFELKVGTLPAFGVCCFSVIKPEKSWASGSACDPRRTSSATDSFGKEIIGDVARVSKDFQRKLAAAHKEADDRHGCAWTAAVCMTRCSPSKCLLLLLPLQVRCPAKGTGQQTSFDTESHGKGQFLLLLTTPMSSLDCLSGEIFPDWTLILCHFCAQAALWPQKL